MRRMRRFFCMLLAAVLVVTMSGTVVFASGVISADPITMVEYGLNELNVRAVVANYFNDRSAYLHSISTEFATAVPAMVTDEQAHRELLSASNTSFEESAVTINSVHCDGGCADVTVTETVTYTVNGETRFETVEHEIAVYLQKDGSAVVGSDAYREEYSNFSSCSYVPPLEDALEPMAAGGSKYCIVYIATGEVGYTESGVDNTKYGAWLDKQNLPWCATFVSWCADQANISSSIIPHTSGAPDMKIFFSQRGLSHLSKSQGGSFTPQVGDLYFTGTSASNIGHVGIVTSVTSSYIYVISGNSSNQVRSNQISISSSDLVGFARPQYANTGHTLTASGAYYVCSACGYKTTHIDEINGGTLPGETG